MTPKVMVAGSSPAALTDTLKALIIPSAAAAFFHFLAPLFPLFGYNLSVIIAPKKQFSLLNLGLVPLLFAACSGSGIAELGEVPALQTSPGAGGLPAAETSLPDEVLQVLIQEYDMPAGSRPHDVAPAADGGVWYTAQGQGAPWITDSGLNAILRVDPDSEEVQVFPLPGGNANLNTATFAGDMLWFTGQNGVYGRLDPAHGEIEVFEAPGGRGPYGITAAPDSSVYFASLAGSYLGRVDPDTGEVTALAPPTANQGARRAWADSQGRIWVSEWNVGQVAVYDPAADSWQEWKLPGESPFAYAVYVDERDQVWLSDFGGNALVRFDPNSETFTVYELPSINGEVRQIHGRPGEVWGAESRVDKLIVIRFARP
jgi:virginiamycin B lyase